MQQLLNNTWQAISTWTSENAVFNGFASAVLAAAVAVLLRRTARRRPTDFVRTAPVDTGEHATRFLPIGDLESRYKTLKIPRTPPAHRESLLRRRDDEDDVPTSDDDDELEFIFPKVEVDNVDIPEFLKASADEPRGGNKRHKPLTSRADKARPSYEAASLTFVSRKWGFRCQLSVSLESPCYVIARELVFGLGLQDHLELPTAGGKVFVHWQLQDASGHVLDPEKSLYDEGLRDGAEVYLHGTVMRQLIAYSPITAEDLAAKRTQQSMFIATPSPFERWTA